MIGSGTHWRPSAGGLGRLRQLLPIALLPLVLLALPVFLERPAPPENGSGTAPGSAARAEASLSTAPIGRAVIAVSMRTRAQVSEDRKVEAEGEQGSAHTGRTEPAAAPEEESGEEPASGGDVVMLILDLVAIGLIAACPFLLIRWHAQHKEEVAEALQRLERLGPPEVVFPLPYTGPPHMPGAPPASHGTQAPPAYGAPAPPAYGPPPPPPGHPWEPGFGPSVPGGPNGLPGGPR